MGFIELSKRLNALYKYKLADIIVEILEKNIPVLIQIQKEQLYAGKNADGDNLSPGYSEDPFFKSPASAKRYAEFKAKIRKGKDSAIFGSKDSDTPDLIINGRLIYDTIFASVNKNSLIISARTSILSKLEAKYKTPFGLNQKAWEYFMETYFIEDLQKEVLTFLNQR